MEFEKQIDIYSFGNCHDLRCSNPVGRTPSMPDANDRLYQMACFVPDSRQLGLGFLDHVRLPILGQGFQL